MKKFFTAIPFLLFLFTACNNTGSSGDPKQVLTNFFTALSKKDIPEARKYVTEDSEGMLNMMQMSIKNTEAPQHDDQFNPDMLVISEPIINGDEAQVPVAQKNSGESLKFFLKKEKGQWKVAFNMATLARMATQKMKEEGVEFNDIDSLLNGLSKEETQKALNELDSIAGQFKGTTDEKLKKAKELFDKDSNLKNIDLDKLADELKKLKEN